MTSYHTSQQLEGPTASSASNYLLSQVHSPIEPSLRDAWQAKLAKKPRGQERHDVQPSAAFATHLQLPSLAILTTTVHRGRADVLKAISLVCDILIFA